MWYISRADVRIPATTGKVFTEQDLSKLWSIIIKNTVSP
jgi:hypothetical protein